VAAIIALVILSWLPQGMEIRAGGVVSGQYEHVVAYLGAAALCRLAWRLRTQWMLVALMTLAAVLELGQLWDQGSWSLDMRGHSAPALINTQEPFSRYGGGTALQICGRDGSPIPPSNSPGEAVPLFLKLSAIRIRFDSTPQACDQFVGARLVLKVGVPLRRAEPAGEKSAQTTEDRVQE
jgi:hypothetical protein